MTNELPNKMEVTPITEGIIVPLGHVVGDT